MAKGITFHGWPNDIIIGFEFVFSLLIGITIVRGLYIWMHRAHGYPNDQVHLAVLGHRALKVLTIPLMAVMLILTVRFNPGIQSGMFWELDSLERGWWCVIRIMVAVVATLCASVFDTHPAFRAWCSITMPLLSILDLICQAKYAVDISCLEHGICEPDDDYRAYLYQMAWRDIISAILTLVFTGISTWLWFIYGIVRNDLHMPRMELRKMAQRLDKIRTKPKEIRRRTDDENQLEKMLGYN